MRGPITRFLLGCALLLYKREVNVLGLTLKNSKIVGDLLTDGFFRVKLCKMQLQRGFDPILACLYCYVCLILVVCLLKKQRTIAYSPQALSLPI